MFRSIFRSANFVFIIALSAVSVVVDVAGSVPRAHADELDEILDSLINERLVQRKSEVQTDKAVTSALLQGGGVFRKTDSYQIDAIRRNERNGVIELSTTYNSLGSAPTFTVRIIRVLPVEHVQMRTGGAPEVDPMETLERIYRQAAAQHETEIHGFKSAFLSTDRAKSRGAIIRLSPQAFLIVEADTLVPSNSIVTFLDKVPLADFEAALGI